jgi:hypothetical protein
MQKVTVLASIIIFFLVSLIMITSNVHGQSSIIKRWQAAGRLENGRIVPHKGKIFEYEFLRNGIFNIYANGAITENGQYVMASDKKSLLLKDVNRRNQTVLILKLTASELNIVPTRGDTIICYAAGFVQRQTQSRKPAAYSQANKDWNEMQTTYMKLDDLLRNYCATLLASDDGAKGMIVKKQPISLKGLPQNIATDVQNLTKQDIETYIHLLDKAVTRLPDFCWDIKSDMASSYADALTQQLSVLEGRLRKDKEKFIKSFKAYSGESLVLSVYEMPKTVKPQLSGNSDMQAEKEWNNARTLYKKRNTLIVDIVNSINKGKDKDSSLYLRYIEDIEFADRYDVEFSSLTKQDYVQYMILQESTSDALEDLKTYLEEVKYEGKSIPYPYKEWLPQLATLEAAIAEAKKTFMHSVGQFLKHQ